MVKSAAATTATTASPDRQCACGCGKPIGRKSTFAMGHDARMVSLAAKSLVESTDYLGLLGGKIAVGDDIQARMDAVTETIEARFGKALADKYHRAAHSAWDKAVNKTVRANRPAATKRTETAGKGEVAVAIDPVKIGRWTYPAMVNPDGSKVRNTKRDGSGEWVPVA